jgi:hypothetical protein
LHHGPSDGLSQFQSAFDSLFLARLISCIIT